MLGSTRSRIMIGLAIGVALSGCGDWVRSSGERQGTGPPSGDAGPILPAERLSHRALGELMRRFVVPPSEGDATVLFDYEGLRADPEARHSLESYLALLASVDPSGLADANERLAYWVNGYNAAAIFAVVSKYDGDRTFRATDGPFFGERIYRFGGVVLSLDEAEHAVLRGDTGHPSSGASEENDKALFARWHTELWADGVFDPRVHAVLNCTALSCPDLLAREPFVYRADLIETQLQQATEAWLADPNKGAGGDGVSKLFEWFLPDFEAAAGSVDAFIRDNRAAGLAGVDTGKHLPYDWTLNIAPPPP